MGNIIIDLDYDMMVSVLRVPNEKFKDKMAKSMRDWVTTLRRELGEAPSAEEVKKTYIAAFQDLFGVELMRQGPTETEWQIFREEVKPRHTSQEWLNMETPPASLREGRMVKIAGDVKMVETEYKAKKLIRVRAEMKGNKIQNIQIRGDFFVVPKESTSILEQMLTGIRLEKTVVLKILRNFYDQTGTQTIGIGPQDLKTTIMKIKSFI